MIHRHQPNSEHDAKPKQFGAGQDVPGLGPAAAHRLPVCLSVKAIHQNGISTPPARLRYTFRWLLMLLVLMGLSMAHRSAAQTPGINEYQLKAAFLTKFPLFVQWKPQNMPDGRDPLVIGILGKNPFGDHLEALNPDNTVSGHNLSWKLCQTPEEAQACHIVFIAASEKNQSQKLFDKFAKSGTLSVGDWPNFAQDGGMIGLVVTNRKIRMEINIAATRKAGLIIDPHLLQMASIIGTNSPPQTIKP